MFSYPNPTHARFSNLTPKRGMSDSPIPNHTALNDQSYHLMIPIKRKTLTLTLHKFIFLIKSMYPHVFYSH